jgi:hypothetical protein
MKNYKVRIYVHGEDYPSVFTVSLPETPSKGDWIYVTDYGNNPVTVLKVVYEDGDKMIDICCKPNFTDSTRNAPNYYKDN